MKKMMVLLAMSVATGALAQTSASLPANTSTGSMESSTLRTIKEKLRVSYFGEFLGPSIERMDNNQVGVDNDGVLEKKGTGGSDSNVPINLFNQISLAWKLNDNHSLQVQPRFTIQFGDRNDLEKSNRTQGGKNSPDGNVIVQEDYRAGVAGKYFVTESKALSLGYSVRNRFPTSKASRDSDITAQPELGHNVSFQATPALNFGLANQIRYYWYEPRVDNERYRFYTNPSVTYSFNDTLEIAINYEHEMQHSKPEGNKKYNYMEETLQDLYAGVNININPSLTLYPFIRLPSVKRPETENTQLGMWIIGSIF